MIRGNRLVIPLRNPREDTCTCRAFTVGDKQYYQDTMERLELSLEECTAIVANLPVIVQFMIEQLPKEAKEVKK